MEFNDKNVIIAYADDIIILEETENDVVSVTEKPIEFSHRMGIVINQNKIKYLIMTRQAINRAALKLSHYSFK